MLKGMKMKEHLAGGTLRQVMVAEVLRTLRTHKGHVETSAKELGITPRTLRLWKHRWPELQNRSFEYKGAMEKVLKAIPKKKKTTKRGSAK